MKAGAYLISWWFCRFSMIEVIIPAAWNAMVRDGYDISSTR